MGKAYDCMHHMPTRSRRWPSMTGPWKFLGPFEGASGMLMFGLSTALIFAIIQRIVETKFTNLKG